MLVFFLYIGVKGQSYKGCVQFETNVRNSLKKEAGILLTRLCHLPGLVVNRARSLTQPSKLVGLTLLLYEHQFGYDHKTKTKKEGGM